MNKQRAPLGNISTNFVCAMSTTLVQLGIDPNPLLNKYQLKQSFLDTPDSRISIPKFMRLGNDAIRISGLAHFGLLMGKHMSVGNMGLPGFAAMTASTLGESLKTLINFELLNSQNSRGHSTFYLEHDRTICQFYSISPYNQFNYFVVDSMLSAWHNFAQWLTQRKALAHQVDIEYKNKQYKNEYEKLFECHVNFGAQRNALIFKSGSENEPSNFYNKASHQRATLLCKHEKERLNKGKKVEDRVVELISTQLEGSSPNIDDIAQKMGVAGWTLRRRLSAEGLQYRAILDQTRSELAKSYVLDTNHNFTEIAFLLGFASPASFQRAFRRWTNASPGDFRKSDS